MSKLPVKFLKSGQTGFTLVELIVVFAALAALSTLGVASFVSYSRSQIMQTAASELSTTINLARSRAYSQVKPEACTSTLEGYRVSIFAPQGEYALEALCGGSVYEQVRKKLPNDLSFDASGSVTAFTFPIIKGGLQGSGGSVVIVGYGQTRTITVNPAGDIR